jgi:SAM-dependent methyltransferase
MGRYWGEIGEDWTEHHRDPVWRAHSDAIYSELLARWLPAGRVGRVLKTDLFDEAVADGVYPVVQERTDSVVGFDVASRVVGAACERYSQLRGIVADARQLPFADGVFDTVISLSTLDHFPRRDDIRRALLQLHRVLSLDGLLIITLDNASNPLVALRNALPHRLLQSIRFVPYRMGATCTSGGFVSLLRACRFEVDEVAFVIHCPRLIAVLAARLVGRMANLRTRARFLRLLGSCERLARWPTRAITGYYTAALARRR